MAALARSLAQLVQSVSLTMRRSRVQFMQDLLLRMCFGKSEGEETLGGTIYLVWSVATGRIRMYLVKFGRLVQLIRTPHLQ